MRTSVALYVLSTVAITITNQAAVQRTFSSLEEENFSSGPRRLLYDDVAAEALGIGREDTYNARYSKNRGRQLEHIWDDVFGEGRDTDQKGRNNKGSRNMSFGTSDETREVKSDDHVERTLLIAVYEENQDLSLETENWTPESSNINEDVGEDNKLKSKQWSESRDSISGKVHPKIDHEDSLWPQNNDEKPRHTNNWTSKTNNTNTDEDDILKSKQMSVTRDNISGKAPLKIDHEDRLWPQNKDEKPSTVNPLGKRKVDQWPDRHNYVQKGNDYWYISDAHPGVAFVLSGISLAGPHVGLFGGEWLQNTAIGEMGDRLPWEQNVKSRNGPHERPEDISLTTRKSNLGIEGERTADEVLTPKHSHNSIS